MSSQRLSVRIPEGLQGDLESLARSTGKSESELVREAIEEYCRKHRGGPSCYDLALKAGLIGCAKDLPADLSTNPQHMDGFGRE
ncbi:MAG: CopG family transcriptional regulator [Planctomycetes bacterium]|nr:CopG family transcriptional regulator [Planctomycetota bacterium]